jgi:hypothetical protein
MRWRGACDRDFRADVVSANLVQRTCSSTKEEERQRAGVDELEVPSLRIGTLCGLIGPLWRRW